MRRLVVAVVVVTTVFGEGQRPAGAAGATVVSGVAVFSPAIVTVSMPTATPQWQSIAITETQQGTFAAGVEAEVVSLSCTFAGTANETWGVGSGALSGSCAGTGVTGKRVTKSCFRAYTRVAHWVSTVESCQLDVGSSTAATNTVGNSVAHLPPPPADRYYYTGTFTDV